MKVNMRTGMQDYYKKGETKMWDLIQEDVTH